MMIVLVLCHLINSVTSQSCNMHTATPMDREGEELHEFTSYSATDCCSACLNNTGCEAWTFVGSDAGACANQCHLKYAVGPVANYSGCCGRSDTYPYCTTGWAIINNPICLNGNYIENTDYYGGDLRDFATDGIDYCCYACTQTKSCIGFSYEKSSQHCFLKSSRAMPDTHNGITSYFINPVPYYQNVATRILYFAYGAYCDSSAIMSWTCKWCEYIPNFVVHSVVNLDSLQAYIGYDPDANQIVISFRGTDNNQDWIDDFDDTLIAYPGVSNGLVHQGFYEAWVDLQPGVLSTAQTLMNKYTNQSVLITGHSLGAALAQLCALDVAKNGQKTNNKVYLYTYGSPRWGNLFMANYFGSLVWYHYRLVNVHDPIPGLPGTAGPDLQHQYHHTWTDIWYTSDEPLIYKQCNGSGEDSECMYLEVNPYDHKRYLGIYEQC